MAQDPWAVVSTKPAAQPGAAPSNTYNTAANSPDPWAVVSHQPTSSQPASADPSVRESVDSYLNNTEGQGVAARFAKGVGRTAAGLVEAPVDLLKPSETPEEAGAEAAGGQAGVAVQRGIIAPAMAEAHKAKDAWSQGHYSEAIGHGAAAAIPFAGPWASSLGERFGRGDVAGMLGELTSGLAVPKVGEKAAGKISSGMASLAEHTQAPLADTVSSPRAPIAPEAATPADLKDYAQKNNIPVNAAQLTEHNLPRGLQSTGERALIGGSEIKKGIKASQAAIGNHVSDLMDQMSPSSVTPNTAAAGANLKTNIASALDREKIQADHNFSAIDQQANGVTVDAKPLKQLATQISQDSAFTREKTPSMSPPRATKIVRDMAALPDQISFKDAQSLRSDLLEEARHPDNAISEKAQGWIKQLSGQTDQSMMDAATQKPGLEQAFRQANDHWKGLQEDFNSPRSPLYQAMKEPVPERVPQKFLQKGSTGGAPSTVQMLQKYGIDTGPLKRELLRDISEDKNFKLYGNDLAGYKDDFLRSVFSPQEIDGIYKTGALARSVGYDANPSRTATVESQAEQVQRPVRSLIPKSGAAKATKSPSVNEWMTRSAPPPVVRGQIAGLRRMGPAAGRIAAEMAVTHPRRQ